MSNPQNSVFHNLKNSAASPVTRRTVLAGAGIGAAAMTLAACAPGGAKHLTAAKDLSSSQHVVTWDNWPYYMDGNDNPQSPTIKGFESQTGIKVKYQINIDDNNTYYARIKNQLAAGKDTGADTFCLTDWMAARLINSGYVQELDYKLLPNVAKNLDPFFKGKAWSYDSDRTHSLPWKGIIAGIGFHKENYKKLTGKDAPTSVADLWAPEVAGKVVVLSEMRDTLGVMMLANGVDITAFTTDDFNKALDEFKGYVKSGQIRGIKGNSYIDDLKNGDAVIGIIWAGDLVATNLELGKEVLGAVIPTTGGTFACDNYLIPMGSQHAANAHALINYYYDPAVAAELALNGVYYVPPVKGAKEIATAKNPAIGSNELIFPSDWSKLHQFRPLTPKEDNEFSKAWSDASNGVV
ncbi:MAG: spermidine/putrescine ABC transporter substrate-binding protein [Actinomycetales bacterium]|nr:spermidine/putrescine ABC transporter substrate-binding protein [Actinomycetales bacterium]